MITVAGKKEQPVKGMVYKVERTWKSGDVVSVKFNPALRLSPGYNNASSIAWRPLSFVLKMGESCKKINIKMDRPIKRGLATGVANWQISPTTD